jgi:pyrroline-5-carboxylate reductase
MIINTESYSNQEAKMLNYRSVGFIGGGNMAEAMIKGLLAGGVPAASILVADPVSSRRDYLSGNYGVTVSAENAEIAGAADVIVLAVKPQMSKEVLAGIAKTDISAKILVSIMAGVTTAGIEAEFSGRVRVVRVMPNTPALAMSAASAISPGRHAEEDDLALTEHLFSMVGRTWRVDEKLMDAVTGLSGSGPAFVLSFLESMADGGVKNGLSRDTALGLAAQTLLGTARLYLETGEHPAKLRDKVTSPGGTTIAGLHALEMGCFRGTVINAVDAAVARSKELGK